MKHVLITGADGQLGRELTEKARNTFRVTALGKNELNMIDSKRMNQTINELKPDCILHAAAYTDVEQCEIVTTKAFDVNALGAFYLSIAANEIGAKLIYVSTDYVFDGQKKVPYYPDDRANPLSVYGKSKWLGERLVCLNSSNCSIVRTSWLYGHQGKNFVKSMLRLAKKNQPFEVVDDQIGSPTYVSDLVYYLLHLIEKPCGTYHVSNAGSCSWYGFAKRIFESAGFDSNLIRPTTTEKFGSKAPRPAYSVMNLSNLQKVGLEIPRAWELALDDFLKEEFQS